MLYRLADSDLTTLAYTGGKARIAHLLARLRPWDFEEYREAFVGGGAVFNYLRRIAPCQRYWINDIHLPVATFHRVLRDDAEVLVERLLDIFAEHEGGTLKLFELWKKWRNSSDPLELATATFLHGQIVLGSERKGYGFAKSRVLVGKALTRSKITRLRGFAELLQGVKITNVDYREVMDAPGRGVFIYADPPYVGVGEDCYKFGKFDLPEFTATIDRCQHSVLWTLNSLDIAKAAFARHNVIEHRMRYTAHSHDGAVEIIGANYTTPLFEVHAREIGTLLPKIPNTKPMILPAAANENICPITIHNQSCADMGILSDGSVHLTVTSPPYNVGIQYGDQSNDTLTLPDYRALMTQVFAEVYRVTAEKGRVCINIANTGRDPYMPLASLFIDLMTEIGFTMRAEIVWNKVGAKSQSCAWGSWCRPSAPAIREHHEHVLIFSKGDWKRSDLKGVQRMTKTEFMEATKSVWNIMPEHRSSHPAPFPVELPRRLIKLLTGPTDVVLDPFTGSGTTALAAQELGNRFVGFELEPRWIELAHQRLAEAGQQRKAA
ncbi:MAG: Site-specific DNA methylase [Stygiobacter sp.]|nr:MAG: Site-specific DNA methylase [Stygiobacter sp.]